MLSNLSKLSHINDVLHTMLVTLLSEPCVILYVNPDLTEARDSNMYWLSKDISSWFVDYTESSLKSEMAHEIIAYK